MTVYQEITLIANADISPYFLWSKVMTQLHIALADIKNKHGIKTIGISFPNYRYEQKNGKTLASLGDKVRIFAQSEDDLDKLALPLWLARLIDYVHLTTIKPVGDKATGYLVVRRYRHKNRHTIIKNYANYHNVSYDDAKKACEQYQPKPIDYPFISLNSVHSDNPFTMFIKQTATDTPNIGEFNTYGTNNMTTASTVPHW